jgi:hypothetical protein
LIEILRFGSAELLGVAIYSNTEAPKRKISTEFIPNVELCVLYSIVRQPKFGYPRCDRSKELWEMDFIPLRVIQCGMFNPSFDNIRRTINNLHMG